MCGIFGGIKNINIDKVKLLGLLNEDRGNDATGLFDAKRYIKEGVAFRYFIANDEHKFIDNYKKYLVGHTRLATTGGKSERNAHPFQYGNITGVHNGMIRNFKELKKKYKQDNMECDSEILFYLINKKGIEGLKEVVGYYTIIWSDDKTPEKLFFIQHECSLAYNRGKDYIYFCTDEDDLCVALGFGVKTVKLMENVLYEINIDTLKIKQTKIKGLLPDDKYASYYTSKSDYDWYMEDDEKYYKSMKKYGNAYPSHKHSKSIKPHEITGVYDKYTIMCPYCNEGLTIDEVHKEKCPFCQTYLSGWVYQCYHCESLVMVEQIKSDNCCPVCTLHMNLDDKHAIKPSDLEV